MTPEELREQLIPELNREQYADLESELSALPSEVCFHLLFPMAVTCEGNFAWRQAGELLVDIEPECPVSCEDALRILAKHLYQPSDHLVPFYLITQFGKHRVREAVMTVKAELESEVQKQSVRTVAYWTGPTTVYLLNVRGAFQRRRELRTEEEHAEREREWEL